MLDTHSPIITPEFVTPIAVRLESVSKAYCVRGIKKQIFKALSYDLPKGRNLAIMGCNGAGKSTLMRLLAGAEHPDSGSIHRYVRLSWPLGFSGGFNGSMSGLENARFVARLYGYDPCYVIEYVRDFSELGESLTLPLRTYSTGMRARLAFGVSMAMDFECYLVDELISVGDENFRQKSTRVFKEKMAHSQIIMASHSASLIETFCDCGIFLHDNNVFFYDTIKELLADYKRTLSEV